MPIHVVCPGCKKRFTVSDKFAGQKGPCPKCKTVITVPKLEEQVVIHAPEDALPKDSKGRSIAKPLFREETRFSTKMAVGIAASAVTVLAIAWFVGATYDEIPSFIKALAAIALAPPLVLGGYAFLRDDELAPYRGRELAERVLPVAAWYAFLWGAYGYIQWGFEYDFDVYQDFHWLFILPAVFVGIGAIFANLFLGLDYLVGLIHCGLYLIVTVLLRVVAGMQPF